MKLSHTLRYSLVLALLFAFTLSLSALDQKLSAEGKKNINSAKIHFGGKRFEKALPLYEAVVAENPNHIDANYKILAIKFEQEEYVFSYNQSDTIISLVDQVYAEYEELKASDEKAAKKFFRKEIKKPKIEKMKEDAITVKKSSYSRLYHAAKALSEANEYAASTEKYLALHELAPDSTAVLSRIANNYIKLEDNANAIKYLEMGLENNPEDATTLKFTAILYEKSGDFLNALSYYDKYIVIEPGNYELIFNCGMTSITKIKDYDRAIGYFEKVIAAKPEVTEESNIVADALNNIIFSADKLGDKDMILAARRRLLVVEPTDTDNAVAIGSLLYQTEKWQELLDFSATMKEIDPETAAQFENLAKSKLN